MEAAPLDRDTNGDVGRVGCVARCECGRTRPESYGTPLLDITELARWLATSQRHVRRLVEEQRVPYLKIGHYVRFDPSDIEAWLDQQRVSMADGEAGKDGPPWVRLSHGAHGHGRTPSSTPRRESSEIKGGDPPWLRYRAAGEG
jgi:excisionase family DNA binding protein